MNTNNTPRPNFDPNEIRVRSTTYNNPVRPASEFSDIGDRQGPPTVTDINYIPGFLAANIGRTVRAEFVIGNAYIDKAGRLISVGTNYFILEEAGTGVQIMCDLYSVKFVNILPR
ncbi:MAG TPA: hypothetical protein PLZ84_04400 [Clostridia bacterium]|nr:hypothetical protein [Clostridia bacterium]